jgi:hypothetical protein
MKRAFMTLGTFEQLKTTLKKLLLDNELLPASDIDDVKLFIEKLTDFMGAAANPEQNTDEAVRAHLTRLYELPSAVRLLVFDRVMKVILAEYVTWCEQVRPESEKDPRPPVEEIEKARDALLDRLPD